MVGTSGNVYAVGDAEHEFSIMSVSKPFVFALVCQALGHEEVRARLGVNATGLPFNSLDGDRAERGRPDQPDGELGRDRHDQPRPGRRPLTPGGGSSTTACPGSPAGRLPLNEEVYASATATNFRNQSIARLLQSYERI